MVTTTVAVANGLWARLPVRTTAPVPKNRVAELCQQLHQLTVPAPVELGQVVLAHALGTEAHVVASRSMPPKASSGI